MPRAISESLNSIAIAEKHGLSLMDISNRRYLGSKQKLLLEIEAAITGELGRLPQSLSDTFAGSGVVAAHFADLGVQVVANDLLLHNAIASETFLLHQRYDYHELCRLLRELQSLKPNPGYITEVFGEKYFSAANAAKLDAMREYLESQNISPALKNAALTSVIYAADKVAQTVGHYDAFFNREKIEKELSLRAPKIVGSGAGHQVTCLDANLLVREIKVEVNFQDPPYNSRQYSSNYHVLENIVRWDKPEVTGVSAKMNLKSISSKYSTRAASEAYEDLVSSCDSDLIVLTYSNTGGSRVSRSNNLLTDDDIHRILGDFGRVQVLEIEHKEFSVGRTSNRDHKERIFLANRGQSWKHGASQQQSETQSAYRRF